MLVGAMVALVSARQFRQLMKSLAPDVVPPGYWTNVGVVLNVLLALIAVALAAHFFWPNR
jgi:putative membrane protein